MIMRSAARLKGSLLGLGNQLSLPGAVRPGSLTLQRCHDISSPSCCVSIIFSRGLHSSETPTDPESKLPLYDAKKGHLVYTGNMTKLVKGVKTFSLSTSLIALGAQPLIIASAKDDLMFKAGLLGSFSMIMFATPLMVHYVTKKYITDIYFNEETKKFTLASRSLFLKRREIEYVADDVTLPFVGGAFTTHIIKGKEYFLQISDFRNKEVYMHMVGYDKPFEYEIKDPNANLKPKKKRKFGLFDEEDAAREKESLQDKRTQIRREAVERFEEEKQQQMKRGSN